MALPHVTFDSHTLAHCDAGSGGRPPHQVMTNLEGQRRQYDRMIWLTPRDNCIHPAKAAELIISAWKAGHAGEHVRKTNPAVVEEPGEGFPAPLLLEHVVDRLGDGIVLRHLGTLGREPIVQLFDEWTSMLLSRCEPRLAAFEVEKCVDAGHGFERGGRYLVGRLALAHVAGDVGQFEELAPCMAPAERAQYRRRAAVRTVEVVVATIGIAAGGAPPARGRSSLLCRSLHNRDWTNPLRYAGAARR